LIEFSAIRDLWHLSLAFAYNFPKAELPQFQELSSPSTWLDPMGVRQIEFTGGDIWSIVEIRKMKRMRHDSNAPGRRLGACVCLVAVILLWAPAWASALQAAGMGCCDGAMCPLHGHAPKKSSSDTNSAKDAPMAGCEHHGRKAAMDCTMACCHPADPAVTGAIVFVLPALMEISAPLRIGPPTPTLTPLASSFVLDPASPPPRTLLLGL
jgi:hypothetical protein